MQCFFLMIFFIIFKKKKYIYLAANIKQSTAKAEKLLILWFFN